MAAADTVIATFGDPADAGRQRMKQSFLGLAFATTLVVSLSAERPALAAPIGPQDAVLAQASFQPYLFGGRHYCWYDSAWSGPGWYWCGYAWRDGLGWGGPRGWNGWRGGYSRGGDHHGPGGAHFGATGGHVGGGMGGVSQFGGGPGHMGGGPGGGGGTGFGGGGGHFAGGA
ncbi:MAG: hypothetical protein JWP86_2771, partial [Phenylobacterium sp.]|nr:hypothetical protein [Phenylobacterium sp.]